MFLPYRSESSVYPQAAHYDTAANKKPDSVPNLSVASLVVLGSHRLLNGENHDPHSNHRNRPGIHRDRCRHRIHPPLHRGRGPLHNQPGTKTMSTFGELLEPAYYTATVDHNSIAGQVSHRIVRSGSLRQVMRFAARFNNDQPPEAEISVYQHNGGAPKLVANRQVAKRYWGVIWERSKAM